MGDDAELYWEMEHNPYFWDEVESCSRNNSFKLSPLSRTF